jgi:hypothetical protein
VGERLPSGIVEGISLPLHEVLNSGTMETLVKDGLHFILGLAVDDERGRV